MEPMLLSQVAQAVEGNLTGPDRNVLGVSIDSRSLQPGQLFVAIKGPKFDGHDFLMAARRNGAEAALVSAHNSTDKHGTDEFPLITVPDTAAALQKLAGFYRQKFSLKMTAVTGSNGKTTTKEMTARVLSQKYRVLKNQGNLNNQYGIPLSLFNVEAEHQAAVMELGMSGFGEIASLCRMVLPELGIITNAGEGHTEFLKDIRNVVRAKAELLEELPASGTALINYDDGNLKTHSGKTKARVLGFSIESGSDYRADDIELTEQGIKFTVKGVRFHLPVLGRHNVYNALAAAAAGEVWGVDLRSAALVLADFHPAAMRLEMIEAGSFKILSDCYNANPQSMQAALAVLKSLPAKRKVAVLGDMKELGAIAPDRHRQVGRLAADAASLVLTAGPLAAEIYQGAKEQGGEARHFEDTSSLCQSLPGLLLPGDLILVKASRSMHFEEALEAIKRI
ncbi:UDP-N-acetylmuramoyl-tripeptide--D-alanyl-D-alanine ligase [candidate division TA06 bacterium]|uniref:UDP-N-acetylmuramoyl-tripeptide--D-alanyl-D-alanine ligase n=1 Tax=candidate division TA06 bacterium TaxID=2250710 RepID=A0A933MHY9_UNCT6|nr:UDP-N-acetylmuramoyl-tripeptide--D-alanyl-D-alanine ligase [candidate division TA06 bacterium]